jgi:hypothetical protein
MAQPPKNQGKDPKAKTAASGKTKPGKPLDKYELLKAEAALKEDKHLGVPRGWLDKNGHIPPEKRVAIAKDVHMAMWALMTARLEKGKPLPSFLTADNFRAVDALLGVEGFAESPEDSSYNDKRKGISGLFQVAPSTYDTYKARIAHLANEAKPYLGESASLMQAMKDRGLEVLTFNEKNIWAYYNNPAMQTFTMLAHNQERIEAIDKLGKEGLVNQHEQMGLLVISHNIPALSERIMKALREKRDVLLKDALTECEPKEEASKNKNPAKKKKNPLEEMIKANPILYKGTHSLFAMLEKASAYAEKKAGLMQKHSDPHGLYVKDQKFNGTPTIDEAFLPPGARVLAPSSPLAGESLKRDAQERPPHAHKPSA